MLENSPPGKNSLIELEEVEQEELNVDVDVFTKSNYTPYSLLHLFENPRPTNLTPQGNKWENRGKIKIVELQTFLS